MGTAPLRRSSNDKVIAGVCGGLGQRFGTDTVVVRLAFLAAIFFFFGSALMFIGGEQHIAMRLLLFSGLSFCLSPLVYLALWIAMPREATAELLVAQMGAVDPTGEWRFDPYTGRAIQR
jgi:phage shock protein C